MTHSSLHSHATTALLDVEQDGLRFATCPLCHTPASVTESALAAGGDWRCTVCAQHWDATRLAAVAAYAAWVVEFEQRSVRQRTEPSKGESHS